MRKLQKVLAMCVLGGIGVVGAGAAQAYGAGDDRPAPEWRLSWSCKGGTGTAGKGGDAYAAPSALGGERIVVGGQDGRGEDGTASTCIMNR